MREYKETCKGSKDGFPIVGLEHLIPEEINLKMWDEEKENTFTKMFRKGQVLFGRRRAYLKKAAVAPFDGICSGDITVIEAIHDKILPELLPFIIQNDSLFNFAVGNSAGSLSPRVKWENLKNYEFNLPDLAEQKRLAELLWAANDAKEAYKRLLTLTDDLVKSQFIEMFGDPLENPFGWEQVTLKDISKGKLSYGSGASATTYDGKTRYVRITDITDSGELNDDIKSPSIYEAIHALNEGDILFARSGATVGKTYCHNEKYGKCIYAGYLIRLIPDKEKVLPEYVFHYTKTDYYNNFVAINKRTVAQPNINAKQYGDLVICVPPLEIQNRFVELIHQTDKSKFELQQTILSLENTIKSIMLEKVG
ncbi:restriction endonuclease subunit S [Schinkia azotoformans]|nr:restriction endonuclease subunit S [Schinkia azotoformans]MEC1726881.1 restriction endonuclease subunit S [Schinkia azotoformans]